MKPKPFSALNPFTVPCATCAPTFRATDDPPRSGGRVFRSSARRTRTWNSNRAERYNKNAGKTGIPRGIDTGPSPGPVTPDLGDEAGLARRLQRWAHPVRGPDDGLERIERLQALTGVEDDGLLVPVQATVLHQLAEHRDGHPARGLGEDARGPGEVADALHD